MKLYLCTAISPSHRPSRAILFVRNEFSSHSAKERAGERRQKYLTYFLPSFWAINWMCFISPRLLLLELLMMKMINTFTKDRFQNGRQKGKNFGISILLTIVAWRSQLWNRHIPEKRFNTKNLINDRISLENRTVRLVWSNVTEQINFAILLRIFPRRQNHQLNVLFTNLI